MLGILDDDQIEAVLRHCSVGRIGCRDGDENTHGHGTSAPPVLFRIRLLSSSGRFERPSPGTHTAAPEPRTAYHFEDHDTLARLMRAHG